METNNTVLTDEEIRALFPFSEKVGAATIDVARAVESAVLAKLPGMPADEWLDKMLEFDVPRMERPAFEDHARARIEPAASEAGAVPYAYEYGRSNGDGTYSVIMDRGQMVQLAPGKYGYAPPADAVKEHPIKPLFLAAPPSAPAAEPIPQAVIDALKVWTGSEPSQSALARAVDAWRDPGAVWEHAHVADSPDAGPVQSPPYHIPVRYWTESEKAGLFAAPAAEPILSLTGAQLAEALEFVAPDRDESQMESIAYIQYGDGHSGKGHYCWLDDCPEDGAILLDGSTAVPAAESAEPAGITVAGLLETFDKLCDYLGIDPEQARKAPGKPSDVFIAAIEARASTAATADAGEGAVRKLLRRALDWMMTGKDRPHVLASQIHEALQGEPVYGAAPANAQLEVRCPKCELKVLANCDPEGRWGNCPLPKADAQGDERAEEDRIDALRLKAFRTNDPDDRRKYFEATSKWFQDRDYRALSRQPSAAASVATQPCYDLRYHGEYRRGWNACLAAVAAAKPEGEQK